MPPRSADAPTEVPAGPAAGPADGAAAAPERTRLAVWRYLRALGANAAEADDLTQETMVVGCRHDPALAPTGHDAFLRGVARNLWLRSRRWWHRRREREVAVAVDELWTTTTAADDGEELLAQLRRCLESLQPRARRALDLHYRDGLSWHDVATDLAMRPNGVKTMVQRARQALRRCLDRSER